MKLEPIELKTKSLKIAFDILKASDVFVVLLFMSLLLYVLANKDV